MTKTKYNKWKYDFLSDFIDSLKQMDDSFSKEAQSELEYCKDDDGELNLDSWHYHNHISYLERAEAARKLIEEVEKL